MVKIVPATEETLPEAKKLIKRVFPYRSLSEQFNLMAITSPDNWLLKKIMNLFGIKDILDIYLAVNEKQEVVGTTGLYNYLKDADEAVWLFWFCVAPEERGKGIGTKLLTYTIKQARSKKVDYLRLYTSDVSNEREAQIIYQKHGLKEVERKNRILYTEIIRELEL
ncbi:MAG: hypothetical protein CIT03_02435 [Methanobacterium sp.]|nr:MAG: hypothetical protein CIT03_02435 [Methanobacterium sp.]